MANPGPKMLNTVNRRLDWVPALADPKNPTVEELNAGVQLTCRVTRQNYVFGITGTGIITDPSPCDSIEAGAPGLDTVEAAFDMFRFKSEANDLAWTTFTGKDIPGFLVQRIGQIAEGEDSADMPYVDGDEVDVMDVLTLSPRNLAPDTVGYEKFNQSFAPQAYYPRVLVAA